MDLSSAVDMLFGGAAPERLSELQTLWGREKNRVRLLDTDRFLLQLAYGSVQVSELALRQIWLTGFAAMGAVNAYLGSLTIASCVSRSTSLAAWRAIGDGAEREDAFGALFTAIGAIAEFAKTNHLDAFPWPAGVPFPNQGFRAADVNEKAGFDLVCMAGAFVFAHEVRHYILAAAGNRPEDSLEEESECDRWALALMLDGASAYAVQQGWPAETVRAKRILGALIGQLVIITLTPRARWDCSDGHPPVRERIGRVLDAAVDPVPTWFWATVSSMLLGFVSWSGVEIGEFGAHSGPRSLAYELCDLIRPA